MNFAEQLKQIRKDRKLSQEDLAELLDVSRQAVSKWEQGAGYPEVEKLLLLSDKLNISLDSLMGNENIQEKRSENANVTGNIIITSPNENVIATCCKVCSSLKMKGGAGSPKYFLMGVSSGGNPASGEPTTLLGWYADNESISKEIREIQNALAKGIPDYELKYSSKVKRHWLSIKIVND